MPKSRRDDSLLPLAGLALAKLALHLGTTPGYGIFRDELYYLASTDRLAWGYVEHPPLSIALLWLSRHVLGDSLFAIRFLPAVAGALTVFVAGLVARDLGGGRRAQIIAALAVFVVPVYLTLWHLFSMNAFDFLFWALLAWIAVRALQREEPRLWLVFGAVAGIGLLNKVSVGFLVFGLVMGLVLTAQRWHLARPWIWLGGGIALLLFLPHLVWQIQLDWPLLEFQANARAEKNLELGALEFAGQQVVLANPVALPLWLAGMLGLLLSPRLTRVRALGFVTPILFVLFVATTAKGYYLSPVYTLLLAAGAVTIEPLFDRLRWLAPGTAALLVVSGLVILPMAIPVLSPERLVPYSRAIGIEAPRIERQPSAALSQLFADMHGWSELVDTVERVTASLPPDERPGAVVLATNYGEAGAIEVLGRDRGLPPVACGHNSYWYWRPDTRFEGPVIALRRPREELLRWFETVEQVDIVRCEWCLPHQKDSPVYVARGLKVPVERFWLEIRRFI